MTLRPAPGSLGAERNAIVLPARRGASRMKSIAPPQEDHRMSVEPMDIEDAIRAVAETFARELQKLREREPSFRGSYGPHRLTLVVEVSDKGGMYIEHTHGYGQSVRAAHFGTLLDEVYRRAGFDDRERAKLTAAGDALLPIEHKP